MRPLYQILIMVLIVGFAGEGVMFGSADPTMIEAGLAAVDPSTRARAIEEIEELGTDATKYPGIIAKAMKALQDDDPNVRLQAAIWIKNLEGKTQALYESARSGLLNDSDLYTLSVKIDALGEFGSLAEDAQSKLVEHLRSTSSRVRQAAVQALVRTGPGDTPAVIEALRAILHDSLPSIQVAGLEALAKAPSCCPAPIREEIYRLMRSEAHEVRTAAAATLGAAARADDGEEAALALLEFVEDEDVLVRQAVLVALRQSGKDGFVRLGLAQGLADRDYVIRQETINAMKDLGKAAWPDPEVLLASLDDPVIGIRLQLLDVLASMAENREFPTTAITELAKSTEANDAIRSASLAVLANAQNITPEILEIFLQAAKADPRPEILQRAIPILTSGLAGPTVSGDHLRQIAEVLDAALISTDQEVRSAAATGLAEHCVVPLRLQTLSSRATEEPDPEIRRAVLQAVTVCLDSKVAAEVLQRSAIAEENSSVRLVALEGLGTLADAYPEGVDILIRVVSDRDESLEIRATAAAALGWHGERASAAADALVEVWTDLKSHYEREDIEVALAHIGQSAIRAIESAAKTAPEGEAPDPCEEKSVGDILAGITPPPAKPDFEALAVRTRKAQERAVLKLRRLDDDAIVEVPVDQRHAVVAVATWCHYSEELIKNLTQPEVAIFVRPGRLAFVLEDEVAQQVAAAVKNGEISAEDAQLFDATLRRRVGGHFVNPSFVDNLPGDVYLWEGSGGPQAFPRLYSVGNSCFRGGPSIESVINIPSWRAKFLK